MPTALVTGSNGKTTTVRLIAACAARAGLAARATAAPTACSWTARRVASRRLLGPGRRASRAARPARRGGRARDRARRHPAPRPGRDARRRRGRHQRQRRSLRRIRHPRPRRARRREAHRGAVVRAGRAAGAECRRRHAARKAAGLAATLRPRPSSAGSRVDADDPSPAARIARGRRDLRRARRPAAAVRATASSTISARSPACRSPSAGSAALQRRQPRRRGAGGGALGVAPATVAAVFARFGRRTRGQPRPADALRAPAACTC